MTEKLTKVNYRDIIFLTLVTLVYFIALKVKQFAAFGTATDLPFYETLFHNTINGKIMWENSNGTIFFGQHFSPFLFLLVPVYYFFQSPLTFLIIQAIGTGIAVIPLYILSYHLVESRIFSVSICLSYFFSRTVNYALMFDFHQEVFYPFIFLFLLLAFIRKKWIWYYIFLILAISIKEDANIVLIGTGLYLIFKREYKHGVITCAISIIMLVLTFKFINPALREPGSEYRFVSFWGDFGNNIAEIILNMINPLKSIPVLFSGSKPGSIFNLFSVFIFLPFGSPLEFFILVMPAWFMLFSSSNPLIYGVILYYGMLITPMLMYSTITTVKRLKNKWKKSVVILSVLLLCINLGNSRIFKQLFLESWKIEPRYETAIEIITKIPNGVPVSAQLNLMPRIPVRDIRDVLPYSLDKAEYLMFDLKGNPYPKDYDTNLKFLDSLKYSDEWIIESDKDGFVLLKKKKS